MSEYYRYSWSEAIFGSDVVLMVVKSDKKPRFGLEIHKMKLFWGDSKKEAMANFKKFHKELEDFGMVCHCGNCPLCNKDVSVNELDATEKYTGKANQTF